MKINKIIVIILIVLTLFSCDSNDNDVKYNNEVLEEELVETSNEEVTNYDVNNTQSSSNTETDKLTNENEEAVDSDTSEDDDTITDIVLSSRDLNSKGYELYLSHEYEKALEYFRASFEIDNDYLYAHYNYACTLGILMELDYPEWYDFRSEIHSHLNRVIEIEPDYIEKIKLDSDLDLIRKDFEYFVLLGYGTETDDDIAHLLVDLDWYINGPGVITPIGGAEFNEDGTFSLSFMNLSMFVEGDFPIDTDSFIGQYEVKDGVIMFYLSEKMLRRRTYGDFFEEDVYDDQFEFKGRLDEFGTLHIEIFDYPIHNWVDEFSA